MTGKYFSVNEVIKHVQKSGYSIDFEDICGCVRKRIIHPVVYIDSIPAHAHETINGKHALAVGFCYLSAYWHMDEDKIIALCDNLLRKQIATTTSINKQELTQIRITSWLIQLRYFEGVPEGHICPKPFSNDLAITGFIFPPKTPFSIHIENIAISEEDLNILTATFSVPSETAKICKNDNILLSSTEREPIQRSNGLRDLIKDLFEKEPSICNQSMWDKLRELANNHDLLQEVTSWGCRTPTICWISNNGVEQKMIRSSFQKYMSSLRNPK